MHPADPLGRPEQALPLLERLTAREPRWSNYRAWHLLVEVRGQRVLIVDETCDSGTTLRLAIAAAVNSGAAEVRTAVAFRTGRYAPDYHALATESTIVLPWDREVLVDGELVINPLYEEALGDEH